MKNLSERNNKRHSSPGSRSLGIHVGIWSVTLCLVLGLVMRIRPFVILWRALVCFAIAVVLGYIFVSLIEKYARLEQESVSGERKTHRVEENSPDEYAQTGPMQSQSNQEEV